jgi:hypothetical protein
MKRPAPKALERFRKFHGRPADRVTTVDFKCPKSLVFVGEGVAVEYRSDKEYRGPRRKRVFRHRFGKGVRVYTDPTGRWLFIAGGKFRVTDWLRD